MTYPEHGAPLTPAECSALTYAAQGLTDVHIARKLGVTPETARTHMRRIRAKLGARNRAHAAILGVARGYLTVAADGEVASC